MIKFSDIKNFPVPVPSLPEQKRIVGILDQAFEGIAKAKQRGVYRGRQQKITAPATIAQMISDATALGANKTKVAAKYGISRETLYKYIRL